MRGGCSDYYSFESEYGDFPENNAKWVRVEDVFGPCWFGRPASDLQEYVSYEFVRGDIPEEHQLKGHKSLCNILAGDIRQQKYTKRPNSVAIASEGES